ncbi:MAG: UDP-N-acetylmuramoyl-L-alanyl-D-glutamate--2,6-diaminopimelate ligase [Lachnospiraceae bacterium]|nr:UDP-N-acetylmuramoyl-L-alanyl-D-glutamate--2,6-diaminopimelate ligase [Lachnospiraceae bacterium]
MNQDKRLSELADRLSQAALYLGMSGCEDLTVSHITADSRQVKPGTLFICKGFGFKKEYLLSAKDKGAVSYISETAYEDVELPCIQVSDVRKASSLAAQWFYGYPAERMSVIGITGTKGKTTAANILKHIFDTASPRKTALLSTGRVDTVKNQYDTHLTTPEPVELQQYFHEAVEADCRQAVMEVSSQAMKMSRVYGVDFDYGIFLNVGEDHIGGQEHPTLEDYVGCKTDFMGLCKTAVINRHTDHFELAVQKAKNGGARCIVYGYDSDCDVQLRNVDSRSEGMSFELMYKGFWYRFSTNLIGAFNVDNLAAAIIVALESGVSVGVIAQAVSHVYIPGRMLVIPVKDFHVVVDYAHNYLSFLKLYEAVRETFKPNRIHTVFGCPGERSLVRRRDMGSLADEYADEIYLTADDPGYEKVEDICREIQQYIHKESVIIPDRTEAVRTALGRAKAGDVVILGGKGAETTQRVENRYEPYLSDELVVRQWMDEHR